jgi:hypothetical protein
MTLIILLQGFGIGPHNQMMPQRVKRWRMWAQSGHMAWHMMTLDTQTWLRGEVPGLGLTDEDVSLLRGWIVISWPLGW